MSVCISDRQNGNEMKCRKKIGNEYYVDIGGAIECGKSHLFLGTSEELRRTVFCSTMDPTNLGRDHASHFDGGFLRRQGVCDVATYE